MGPFGRYQLHHVGIIVPSFADAEALMEQMELEEEYRGRVGQWQCWCIFTKPGSGPAIELVVPEGGPLMRFNKGTGGVHHYAYLVDDIAAASAECEAKGMRMLEPEAIRGAGAFLCNFITPLSLRGLQVEPVQPLDPAAP